MTENLRIEALRLANTPERAPAETIERAKKFHEFLNGDADAKHQTTYAGEPWQGGRRGSEAEAMDYHVRRTAELSPEQRQFAERSFSNKIEERAQAMAFEAGLGVDHSSATRAAQHASTLGANASTTRRANDYQPGGNHYKRGDTEHWDFVCATGLHYLPACASKYVGRWRFKNGRLDLEKALHYTHKAEEERVGPATCPVPELLFRYATDNELNALEILATWALMLGDWRGAADAIGKLMASDNLAAQAERA